MSNEPPKTVDRPSSFAPLRDPVFRTLWSSANLANVGLYVQTVAAAWTMATITSSAVLISSVAASIQIPVMVLALVSGALGDLYERRKIPLAATGFAIVGSGVLAVVAAIRGFTPISVLLLCLAVGSGMAVYNPIYQSAAPPMVRRRDLQAAVALNLFTYNATRASGPAVGGLNVNDAGAAASCAAGALLLPQFIALLWWKPPAIRQDLPREGLRSALVGGLRYVGHSPVMRTIRLRAALAGLASGSVIGLLPLVTREVLTAGSSAYGVLLASYGVGAMVGSFVAAFLRSRVGTERSYLFMLLVGGAALLLVAFSIHATLSVVGCQSLASMSVQFLLPSWVLRRALASFQSCVAGGIAIGAWGWGEAADRLGVVAALAIAGGSVMLMSVLGQWMPMPELRDRTESANHHSADPTRRFPVAHDDGPGLVDVTYEIRPDDLSACLEGMTSLGSARRRNGAAHWLLSRDLEDKRT